MTADVSVPEAGIRAVSANERHLSSQSIIAAVPSCRSCFESLTLTGKSWLLSGYHQIRRHPEETIRLPLFSFAQMLRCGLDALVLTASAQSCSHHWKPKLRDQTTVIRNIVLFEDHS